MFPINDYLIDNQERIQILTSINLIQRSPPMIPMSIEYVCWIWPSSQYPLILMLFSSIAAPSCLWTPLAFSSICWPYGICLLSILSISPFCFERRQSTSLFFCPWNLNLLLSSLDHFISGIAFVLDPGGSTQEFCWLWLSRLDLPSIYLFISAVSQYSKISADFVPVNYSYFSSATLFSKQKWSATMTLYQK